MNLKPYWKPSLLLLAFASVGTASSPAACRLIQLQSPKQSRRTSLNSSLGSMLTMQSRQLLMTPRISSLWNVVVLQPLGSKPTERASRWALPMTLFGESVSSTRR